MNAGLYVYATRYALGRSTYSVKEVVDAIVRDCNDLPNSALYCMHKDITKALAANEAGMPQDVEDWERAVGALENAHEQLRRNSMERF